MATAFVHRAHVLRIARPSRVTLCRNFSRSAPALKKQRKASVGEIVFDGADDDLFSSTAVAAAAAEATAAADLAASEAGGPKRKGKAPALLFDEQYAFVVDRLGPRPRANHPQVRANAVQRLLHHSEGAAQMTRLVELLAAWRNDGRVVDAETTLELIDRCLAWHPALLVQLFADRPRYGLTLPSLSEARRILHRLVRPPASPADALRNAATFAALYPAHGLPPASTDLTSCTLLAQACARALSPAAKKAGEPELGAAAQRGLVSLAADLARGLAPPHARRPLNVPGGLARLGKGDHAPSVRARREGGFSPTRAAEWAWTTRGLADIVRALRSVQDRAYVRVLSAALAARLGTQKKKAEVRPGEAAKKPEEGEAQLA
ncbi:hypothetical protein DFH11DRAFT_1728613 [Phellopilus nigrolimitatus]|nr:hypothetical protein DFH11DRAFT_1728613 [Phellopilus nigrolimitatus]